MAKTLGLVILIGCAMTAAVTQDEGHLAASNPFQSLDELTASGKHKSWCSFKAASARIWCQMKAQATLDAVKRKIGLDNCAYNYNVALQACPRRRRLSAHKSTNSCIDGAFQIKTTCFKNAKLITVLKDQAVAMAACHDKFDAAYKDCFDRRLSNSLPTPAGQKHKSWCSFKAAVANKWCQTKAVASLNADKRNNALAACALQYNTALSFCPKRRLENLLRTSAQKHKSWCTFKASVNRAWCKTKGTRWDKSARSSNYINCDNAYNLQVAQCAQRRLMRDFEKAIKSGNAHEGWCEFKNRSRWLWCKATKSVSLNAEQRRASLAQCDANYNQGDAICRNANLAINVSTTAGASN